MRISSDPDCIRTDAMPTRRGFLALAAAAVVAAVMPQTASAGGIRQLLASRRNGHPDPRPGIDASRVLKADQLADAPHLIGLFDSIREIPHIVDGIRCYCGCADIEGYRSLLSCYEAPAMARFCEICEGQGRLAFNRSKEGQTLDQIRRATDARYGRGSGERSMTGREHHHR